MTPLNKARIVILGLAFAAYAPALPTGFLYDDHILIEANPEVRTLSLAGVAHTWGSGIFDHPTTHAKFYRPLQVLSTQIEYALWGLNPFPYHFTNLLFHIGNALLVLELAVALGLPLLSAGLAAGLFAVHPIIVEDMLMVSGRGELMGLFFMLASVLLALRQPLARMWMPAGAYLLALFSKESALITPVILAAAFYFKKEKNSRYLLLIPMAAMTALYFVARYYVLGALGPELEPIRYLRFLLIAFPHVLLRYARILVWPVDLHTDRLLTSIGPLWFASTACVAAVAVALFTRGPRWARFSFVWYVAAFLPKVPLMISGSFMSDHWAYPALLGLTLPLGILSAQYWQSPRRPIRYAVRGLMAAALVGGLALTVHNIQTRNTDEKLYRSALQHTSSRTMRYNLAIVLLQTGRAAEALPYLQSLYAAHSDDANLCRALAAALFRNAQRPEALALLDTHVRRFPDDKITHQMLQDMRLMR